MVVLADGGGHLSSADGIAWADTMLGLISTAAAWAGTQWVAVSYVASQFYTSPDGIKWSGQESHVGASINSLVWSGSRLVGVGNGGAIVTGTPASIAIGNRRAGKTSLTAASPASCR